MSAQGTPYSKKFTKDRFIYGCFELLLMNKTQSIKTFLLLGTIVAVGMIGLTSSTNHVFAGKNGYDNNDDHINWKKFKNSSTYDDADKKTQKCFERAHDRGDNLAGYEVEKCENKPKSYD
jgi:hypothetical protein